MKCVQNIFLIALIAVAYTGCEKKLSKDLEGPFTFEVDIVSGDIGTTDDPREFSLNPFDVTIDILAVNDKGEIATDFNSDVHLRVEPRGDLASGQAEWATLEDGVASGLVVSLEKIHNTATIWAENTGTDEAIGNFATGLSEQIYVANPTVRNIQEVEPDPPLPTWNANALQGDFVEINLDDRIGVVTGLFNDGFFMTDKSEPDLLYSSAYVYSHNLPDVEVGDRVVQLSGTVDEFYGFTELSFPSWRTSGTTEVPDPIEIDEALLADDQAMEPYESALVEVNDVLVCPLGEDFSSYGQWIVALDSSGSCASSTPGDTITIISSTGAPDFNPADYEDTALASIRGNLRYHMAASTGWIIYVRTPADLISVSGEAASAAAMFKYEVMKESMRDMMRDWISEENNEGAAYWNFTFGCYGDCARRESFTGMRSNQ